MLPDKALAPMSDAGQDIATAVNLLETAIDLLTDKLTGRGYNREAALAITAAQESRAWGILSLGQIAPKRAASYHLKVAFALAKKHGFSITKGDGS